MSSLFRQDVPKHVPPMQQNLHEAVDRALRARCQINRERRTLCHRSSLLREFNLAARSVLRRRISHQWPRAGGSARKVGGYQPSLFIRHSAFAVRHSVQPRSRHTILIGDFACLLPPRSLSRRLVLGGTKTIGHREPSVPVPNSLSPASFPTHHARSG